LSIAQANIDAFRGIQDFDPLGPAFDASAAAGKTVFTIPSGNIDFHIEILEGIQEAADATDVEIVDCPNQGTVSEWVECFGQALVLQPDLILLQGSPSPSQLQPQIEEAIAAGIPVVANHHPRTAEFPDGSLPDTHDTGLTAFQPGPFRDASNLIADFALVNQPDANVNMLLLTADETPASVGMREMIINRLNETCPDTCSTTVVNVPIPDWATRLQSETTTAITRDPDINWVVPIYDGMYFAVAPGIEGSGRADEIKTVSFNGSVSALQLIADGVVDGTMGENLNWIGWSSMDQVLRVLAGVDPIDFATIDQSPTPLRVFDASNVDETGTPPEYSKGYGDAYQPGYLALWGLG
jgi:ribose transport system substrate-binding protein